MRRVSRAIRAFRLKSQSGLADGRPFRWASTNFLAGPAKPTSIGLSHPLGKAIVGAGEEPSAYRRRELTFDYSGQSTGRSRSWSLLSRQVRWLIVSLMTIEPLDQAEDYLFSYAAHCGSGEPLRTSARSSPDAGGDVLAEGTAR